LPTCLLKVSDFAHEEVGFLVSSSSLEETIKERERERGDKKMGEKPKQQTAG
jgi:hypothetical protein